MGEDRYIVSYGSDEYGPYKQVYDSRYQNNSRMRITPDLTPDQVKRMGQEDLYPKRRPGLYHNVARRRRR